MATLYPDVCIRHSRWTNGQQEVEEYTIGADLSNQQKVELKNLLQEYKEVLWTSGQKLSVVNVGVKHSIRLKPGSLPNASKPRRLFQKEMEEVGKEIIDLFK